MKAGPCACCFLLVLSSSLGALVVVLPPPSPYLYLQLALGGLLATALLFRPSHWGGCTGRWGSSWSHPAFALLPGGLLPLSVPAPSWPLAPLRCSCLWASVQHSAAALFSFAVIRILRHFSRITPFESSFLARRFVVDESSSDSLMVLAVF